MSASDTPEIPTTLEPGGETATLETTTRPEEVELGRIRADFTNHRYNSLDSLAVASLRQSIHDHGLLSRLLVRPHSDIPDSFQLIFGHRRMLALQLEGWGSVPVEIREGVTDAQARLLQAQENFQSESLSPVEEALVIRQMIDLDGKKQREAASEVGMDPTEAGRRLKLLELAKVVRDQLHTGRLSAGHGNVLGRLLVDDEAGQIQFAGRAVEEDLSVRALETYVKEYLDGDQEDDELVEERIPNLPPTPTPVLAFRAGQAPGEDPSLAARDRRLLLVAMLMAFNDQNRRDELGLTYAAFPADVARMDAFVQELSERTVEKEICGLLRRFYEAGHRKDLIPPSITEPHMEETFAAPPPGAERAVGS